MRDPVTGNPMPCRWSRGNPDMCDEEGKWYEPQEKKKNEKSFLMKVLSKLKGIENEQ
jgi:hypothetical protein